MLREFRDRVSEATDRYAQAHPINMKAAIAAYIAFSAVGMIWAHSTHPEPTQEQKAEYLAAHRTEINQRCQQKFNNVSIRLDQVTFDRCVADTVRQDIITEYKVRRQRSYTPLG